MSNTEIHITRKGIEIQLNEIGIPYGDKKSNGGRIPDHCKYGSWLRRNDLITFNCYYNDQVSFFTPPAEG